MKLNRTGSNWTELERNKINENWDIIEGGYNDVVGKISDEVVGHLIDSAKLIWKEPVDTYGDLPTNAEVGETRMVREAVPEGISYVYRFDGEKWEKIQEIDVTLVNEVDRRLSAQLAEKQHQIEQINYIINRLPGDGVTNVTDILQSEFDYAKTIGAKRVVVPSGTHIIDSRGVKYEIPNSELVFDGVLKLNDFDEELIGNFFMISASNVDVINLKIDGDMDNNIYNSTPNSYGRQFNFAVYDRDNVNFYGGWSKNALQCHVQTTSNVRFYDFVFDTSGEHGIYMTAHENQIAPDYAYFIDCTIKNWSQVVRGSAFAGRDYFLIQAINCKAIIEKDSTDVGARYIDSTIQRDTLSDPRDKWHIYEGCHFEGLELAQSIVVMDDINFRLIDGYVNGWLATAGETSNVKVEGTTFHNRSQFRTVVNPANQYINCVFKGGRFRANKDYKMINCDIYFVEDETYGSFIDHYTDSDNLNFAVIEGNTFYGFVPEGRSNGIIRCNQNIREVISNNNFIDCGDGVAIWGIGADTIVANNHDISMGGLEMTGDANNENVVNNTLIDSRL